MPGPSFPLLYDFVVFAESPSIGAAARRIGITQPALTKRLQALQNDFDRPLFAQNGKRKVLTPFGQSLYQVLKDRVGGLEDLVRQVINQDADPEQVRVRIAARREILDRLADRLLFAGQIDFVEQGHDQILESLKNRKADLGLTHAVPDSHEWIARPLFREKFQFVVPKRLQPHGFSLKEASAILPRLPCLAYNENDEVLFAACHSRGIEPRQLRVVRSTENYQTLARMLEAGLGWAVIPVYFTVSEHRNWIFEISPQVFHPREFKAVFRAEMARTPWLRELLREIQAVWKTD